MFNIKKKKKLILISKIISLKSKFTNKIKTSKFSQIFQNFTVIPTITDICLKVYPDKYLFFKDLMRCIAEGANSIQAFERWSRHDDMRKYVRVLEEWDAIVGDDWENADSNYLNPSEWLDNSPNEMF